MEEYYNRRAPEYEQIYYRDVPGRQQELAGEADRVRVLAQGKRVLEIACGTGYWTRIMAESAKSIDAFDLAPEMIRQAKLKEYTCPVTFAVADMKALPVASESYDLVALGFWYSHQPRQELDSLYDILTRPLKPGGKIWMIDNNPPAESDTGDHVEYDEHGNNFRYRWLDNGERHTILKNYFTRDELTQLLAPRFAIYSLIHNTYYWSAVLTPRPR